MSSSARSTSSIKSRMKQRRGDRPRFNVRRSRFGIEHCALNIERATTAHRGKRTDGQESEPLTLSELWLSDRSLDGSLPGLRTVGKPAGGTRHERAASRHTSTWGW